MMDDLAFLRERIVDYREYSDESARNDSDMRVRAFVGKALTDAQLRLHGSYDAATAKVLDDVLMRCMFTDQVFIRKFEHARLEAPMVAALVRGDRTLVELAERAAGANAAELHDILIAIDKQFEYRRSPEPVPS